MQQPAAPLLPTATYEITYSIEKAKQAQLKKVKVEMKLTGVPRNASLKRSWGISDGYCCFQGSYKQRVEFNFSSLIKLSIWLNIGLKGNCSDTSFVREF